MTSTHLLMSSPSREYHIYDNIYFFIRDVSDTSAYMEPQRGENNGP